MSYLVNEEKIKGSAKVTKKETRETLSAFEVKADDCIECGKCESICPQSIDIRERLKKLAKL